GDVAFVYADQLIPAGEAEVARLWHELRVELNVGQYLDMLGTARSSFDRASSHLISRYKSGRYTIMRPLQLGAALARDLDLAGDRVGYADPLGEAFQLRDAMLGVFGDATRTGKPVGDDLREGKPTLLLAVASEKADSTGRALLDRVGDPDLDDTGITALQTLLHETGAVNEVEAEIARLRDRALDALEAIPLKEPARSALADLAHFVVARDA